ncbi:uncharacterized protein LOC110629213 [Manihot esculenta]|uniref:uncharacterized protein LOC110629213 n=1 Tax=Manihot esculenta TaxID=3983 RepID=UPI000B5D485A|nr:uncharacterized protein LOC110629213 [Manihot esculenta]
MVSPDFIRDFRHIALCNVLYKILAKDNVLIAFELLHGMKRERLGGEGPAKWIEWMMLCVTTINYSMIYNNAVMGPIKLKGGLRANECESRRVKEILKAYKEATGQAINFQKSGLMFSPVMAESKKQAILGLLGVHNSLVGERYLGLPSLVGRNKKQIFNYIKERLWNQTS